MSAEKEPDASVSARLTVLACSSLVCSAISSWISSSCKNEYDKMIDFIKGCQGSETEYSVFKGEDLYDVETGRTWNPLKEFIAKRKKRR